MFYTWSDLGLLLSVLMTSAQESVKIGRFWLPKAQKHITAAAEAR